MNQSDQTAGVEPSETAVPATGHPEVDAVLTSLEGLDARPLEEHVRTFEAAHERLRAALSAAGEDSGGRAGPAPSG